MVECRWPGEWKHEDLASPPDLRLWTWLRWWMSGCKGRDSPGKQKNLPVSITDWIYMGGLLRTWTRKTCLTGAI